MFRITLLATVLVAGTALASPSRTTSFTTYRSTPQLQPGTTLLQGPDGIDIGRVHTEDTGTDDSGFDVMVERWVLTDPDGVDALLGGYTFIYQGPASWSDHRNDLYSDFGRAAPSLPYIRHKLTYKTTPPTMTDIWALATTQNSGVTGRTHDLRSYATPTPGYFGVGTGAVDAWMFDEQGVTPSGSTVGRTHWVFRPGWEMIGAGTRGDVRQTSSNGYAFQFLNTARIAWQTGCTWVVSNYIVSTLGQSEYYFMATPPAVYTL